MQQVQAVVARGKGAPVERRDDQRARPGPGRGGGADPGLRGLPHRPALPRGRHQRRLPVPARPRGGRGRGVGRRGRHRASRPATSWSSTGGRCAASCRACRRGEPWYCFATHNATQKMTLEDGTELSPALGIGAFAEKTLVAAGQCTKVDPAARPAAVGLLGCGVMAGLGAAINTGDVSRGKSVAVIGCGGVGVAAIAGSALAGASPIIAVDIDDREARAGAARHGRHPHRQQHGGRPGRGDPGRSPAGYGADVVIDAVGRPETWKQAFYARDLAGTRRPGRRAHAGHEDPRHPADRRLRARRGAEVQLVRRLPALAATSRCWSTSTSRAGSTSTPSSPRRSASATWRRRSTKMHHGDVLRSVVIL